MSLRTGFNLVLEEYPVQKGYAFTGNDLASFIRTELPDIIEGIIGGDERYQVRGSAGQGNWANCPWVAVFDRLVTRTAQRGYYVVYLFQEDFGGLYLSLNQGVTSIRERYGADAKHALAVKASDYLAQLGSEADGLIHGPIDLKTKYSTSLAADYEVGSICAKYYDFDQLPRDDILADDLRQFLRLYALLTENENIQVNDTTQEDDEVNYTEDLRTLRLHKRIERNQKLVQKAKAIHGYVCQVCGFDFSHHYGPIGQGFIEAHHLTPLAELRGQKLKLDPKRDFVVLCANCHRMIHKTEYVGDVEAFREIFFRP